jgi:predicted DNA-binding transcriptional regulator YafY
MTYESGDGVVSERVVHPLGLVVKTGLWYLVAFRADGGRADGGRADGGRADAGRDGEMHTYRISRIKAAQITNQPATRPTGFDLAEYWHQSVKAMTVGIPRVPFVVRVRADVTQRLHSARHWVRVTHIAPADAEGWARAELTYETLDEACAFVLGFGTRIEVLAPSELRAFVGETAREVARVYSGERSR